MPKASGCGTIGRADALDAINYGEVITKLLFALIKIFWYTHC